MQDSTALREFLVAYTTYVKDVLEPTRQELRMLFSRWREPGYWAGYSERSRLPNPSPIQRVRVRIKRPESAADKILRKPSDFPEGLVPQSCGNMSDAVGARITVYFLAQMPLIDRELRNCESLEISESRPPVAYLGEDLIKRLCLSHLERQHKDSGYASIHYILRLRESSVDPAKRPWFELQVRTLVEDTWAEIEHVLGYKPNKRTSFAVRKQFQIISSELAAIDEHFNFLYEELTRFQEETTFRDSDPLNAENLPGVLAEVGVGCAQREIDGLLKLLVSRGLLTVGSLRATATTKRLELIRNTYRAVKGRTPGNFEVVANLANLAGCEREEEEVERIKAQIAYMDVWYELELRR